MATAPMHIGVIGLGRVGRFIRDLVSPYAAVTTYDFATDPIYPYEALAECDFAVVCVDTPSTEDGACDTSKVEAAVAQLPVRRILIKSTVAPGTTQRLVEETGKEICLSPEYIADSGYGGPAWEDGHIGFLVLGGEPGTRRFFADRFLRILGPSPVVFQCTALEAELIKYMENSFLATKVTFVNEFYDICQSFGADWHVVREGWLLDGRVGRSHSAVFPDEREFGGKCLPKDVRAIVAAATEAGYRAGLLQAVLTQNARFRAEEPAARYG